MNQEKNKSQITRYKKKIILYLSFTLLTKLTQNYIQTNQFSPKAKNSLRGKQVYVFCKKKFKLRNII